MNGSRTSTTPADHYCLRLFVAGTVPRSLRVVESLRRICETHMAGRYELEVVDIYQQPDLAERDGILAAPTLLKVSPHPERRISGDLLDEGRILRSLQIEPVAETR
ncbi:MULTISPECIES: circadian clock KaiB family protein [Methylobacterium]|uniref:Circadian clock KaiB family protein n=1 Tax=Methylobacterium longum TaxID=767694 RepID=A0ABT8AKW4_9HYPH|nr:MULTISPECIES: circadian clock KaiB family protein [Methylobacterium]MCJ2101169.1 circadian clock KaiB family protein [Methylobacterium sp. E-046]MDN3570065.1 circadian clock KaiB family protein [Methylobacterium longum]GJE14427.1 Circadian clock protein KaiB [Methylobacterium longum]